MSFRANTWVPKHPFRTGGEEEGSREADAAPGPADGDPTSPEDPNGDPTSQPENVDLEALKEAVWAEARAQAQAEIAEDRKALATALEELETAVKTVSRLKVEALQEGGHDMAAVILAVIERVLKHSLALHPDALKTVIDRALEQLPESDEVTVHVSPGTLAQVRTLSEPRCRLVADGDVDAGCVVRTSHVTVDATVEATLRGVDGAVRAWLSEQPWVTEWMLAEVDR